MGYKYIISGIYEIKNRINNKSYVGSSCNINRRLYEHRSDLIEGVHHNKHLQQSWNKYGKEAFTFQLVKEYPIFQLLDAEAYWIRRLKSGNRMGYNIVNTPQRPVHAQETKHKISKTLIGHPVLKDTREKIRRKLNGHKISIETREKIRVKIKTLWKEGRYGKRKSS